MILLVAAACLMYHAEHDAQPKTFSSIPAARWWAAARLTTIGYVLGRRMASIIAVLGIGMFALPTGILDAGSVKELDADTKARRCPHCGKEITS